MTTFTLPKGTVPLCPVCGKPLDKPMHPQCQEKHLKLWRRVLRTIFGISKR